MNDQLNKKQTFTPLVAVISMVIMVILFFIPHSQYSMLIEMQEPGADGLVDWSISLPGLMTTLTILLMSAVFVLGIVSTLCNYFFNLRSITKIVKILFILETISEVSVLFSNLSVMKTGNYITVILNVLMLILYLIMDYFFITKPYKELKKAIMNKAVNKEDENDVARKSRLNTLEGVLNALEKGEISKEEAYKIIAAML